MKQQIPLEILVIDDDPGICDLLKEWIEKAGANPTLFSGGDEAVEDYLKKSRSGKPYDAVLTDMLMPAGSGTYVIYQIKQISPETPVIAVTAFDPYQVNEFLSNQSKKPDAILTKPFRKIDITHLIKAIEAYKANTQNPFSFEQIPMPYQS